MRPIAHALPGALAELLAATPLSDGKVAFAWTAAVGPALGRVTSVKLSNRVLVIETAGAQWSREIMRMSPVILARLQRFLGADAVETLEVRRA